jgi:hypothetical protein
LRSRVLTAFVAALTLALGTAACGEDDEETNTATEQTQTEATGSEEENTAPTEPAEDEPEQPEEGEDAEAGLPDPEEAIEDAVDDALASGDPQLACEQAVTEEYVSEAYGSAQGCRSAQGGGAVAEAVTLEEFEVDGSRASGVVAFQGGTYDGEEGDVELVLEGEAWKLDSLQVDIPPGP